MSTTPTLSTLREIRARHPKLAGAILDAATRGSFTPAGKNADGEDLFNEQLVVVSTAVTMTEAEMCRSAGGYLKRGGGSQESFEKEYRDAAARIGL
jgi:hypothetical protein